MQTLHQELDPSQQGLTTPDHPVLRGLTADTAAVYAEEVRSLRQRVAQLEAELAASRASTDFVPQRHAAPLTAIDFASPRRTSDHRVSEFSDQLTPAVVAVQPTVRPAIQPTVAKPTVAQPHVADPQHATLTKTVQNPGFAHAWSAEDQAVSFEERVAEKAFFQATSVDEESRSWLLTD